MPRAALLVVAGQDVVGVVGNVLASAVGDHPLLDRPPEGAQGGLQGPFGRAVHLAPGEHPIMGLGATMGAKVPFWDVRKEVGATSSIVFSYFMELEESIDPDLAATLLYAIESDLAGA